MRLTAFRIPLTLFFALACSGADGMVGPIGPTGATGATGPQGAPGRDAVVDSRAIADMVKRELPAPRVDTVLFSRTDTLRESRTDTVRVSRTDTLRVSRTDTLRIQAVIPDSLVLRKLYVSNLVCIGIVAACGKLGGIAQLEIASAGSADILLRSNLGLGYSQDNITTQAHVGWVELAEDGGLRFGQNHWAGKNFIDPIRSTAYFGPDSQGDFSWFKWRPGTPNPGTQSLVLRDDPNTGEVYFALWRPGMKLGVRTSSEGCKWCENLRWTFPGQ